MTIKALGYLGFHANSIEDWTRYGAQFLGLQLAEQSAGTLAFRMDDRKQRLLIHGDTDRRPILGWELEDAAAADQLAARLERAEVRVDIMDKSMAGQRRGAFMARQRPGTQRQVVGHRPTGLIVQRQAVDMRTCKEHTAAVAERDDRMNAFLHAGSRPVTTAFRPRR